VWLIAALGFVACVIFLDSSGLLSKDAEVVVDDSAQLFGGLAGFFTCLVSARRLRGVERRWRHFMAFGMAGWSVGQSFWSWYQIFSDTPLPSPSWADVGFLMLPVGALPALVVLGMAERRPGLAVGQAPRRGSPLVFFLDGLVIVGSLFILTWSTSLGAVVDAGAPNVTAFLVAIAYPLTDWVLVVLVLLFAVTQRVQPQYRLQMWLVGLGLVAISASDSIFAYLVSSGAEEMPPATNFGFIAGPLLIAVAATVTADGSPAADDPRTTRIIDRAHLLMPYGLVLITGMVVAAQMSLGHHIDALEAAVAWVVLTLVLIRQIITLIENNALLEQVSSTQAELAWRAQHDPLTGLPNRALFSERLDDALDRHRDHGRTFSLLIVDLDDFKSVNDSFGHAAGDELLLAVGARLRSVVRSGDTVARLGGDEFAVVLDGIGDNVHRAGDRVLDALRQPFLVNGQMLALGASIGVVQPRRGDLAVTADTLLERADSAMYVGKRQGKGQAVHIQPI
jgi:diguanylate cyclase (GGDEF)-like protein